MIRKQKILAKRIGPYIFTLTLIGLIFYFAGNRWSEFSNVTKISPSSIFWLSILFVFMQIVVGYNLKVFVEVFDIKLTTKEWFGLVCVQSFVNYLPLSAGLAYNATYLRYKNNLPFTKYVSLTAGSTVLMFLVFGFWGVISLLIRLLRGGELNIILFSLSLVFIFVGLGALLVPLPVLAKKNRIFSWIQSLRDGWELIRKSNKLLIKVIVLHTLILLILSARFFIIVQDLGYDLDIIGVVLLTIMTTLIRFSSILPGNLGVRETIAGGVAKSFGLSFSNGFLIGIVDRVISMFWIFLLGIIFSFVLINNKIIVNKPA